MGNYYSKASLEDLQSSLADVSGEPIDEIQATFDESRKEDIISHLTKYRKAVRNKRIAIATGLAAVFSLGAGVATDKIGEMSFPTIAFAFTSLASARSVNFWKSYGHTCLYGDLIDAKTEKNEREIMKRHAAWFRDNPPTNSA